MKGTSQHQPTEYRTNDDPYIERHGKQEESSALILLLLDDLGDHGPHDADVSIEYATEAAEENSDSKVVGEAKAYGREHGTQQAQPDDTLAAPIDRVGEASPEDSGEELGSWECGMDNTSLVGDCGVG